MIKFAFLLCLLLLLPISANCATTSKKNLITIDAPPTAIAGEKIQLQTQTSETLPASSFYRVEIECPHKPAEASVTVETGYPISDLAFSQAGSYTCIVSLGILTKSSCAGVQYKALGEQDFSIEILPR